MLSRPEYEREAVETYRPRAGDYEAYAARLQGYYETAQDPHDQLRRPGCRDRRLPRAASSPPRSPR